MSNSNVVGQIALELGINSAEFKKQLRSLGKTVKTETASMTKMFSSVGTVIAGALAVGKIINFSKACIQLGSDLNEVQNVVDVTFGSMSEQVNAFAKDAMKSYGLSEKVAKQYMGTFGAMSKSFGYTEAAAYDQAAALTGLVGDVASFYNLTTDEAYTKLKSVFTGETESLKDLGVVMTQTALDEYALQKGMGKTTSEMSEQEKVALRLAFVQDRLATASGDFARTSEGWANQTRVLTLKFESLKATLGQGFINVLSPLLPLINELVDGLSRLAEAFYTITVTMFGDASGGASGALSGAATSSGVISENMSDTVGSAKSLKKILAGFDQLNILGGSSGGDGSGSAGTGGAGSGGISGITGPKASTPGYDTSALQETVTEITAIVGAATLAIGALFTFTGANIPLGIGLMLVGAGSLAAAVAMNWNAVSTQIASTLDLITTIISGASLVTGAILCFSGVHLSLGIALLAVGAAGLAATAAMNWSAVTNEIKLVITGIMAAVSVASLALGIILLWAGVSIPLGIALLAAGATGLVATAGLNWGAMQEGVGSTMSTIAAIVGGAMLALGAVLAFSGLFVGLGIGLMAAGAVSLAAAVAPNWSGMSDKTKKTVSTIAAIAGGALLALGVILLCCGVIPLGIGMLVAGGASLAGAIGPNWDAITSKIKSICSAIGGFFSNLWEGIKKGFKTAVNGIISYANTWIAGLNALLVPVRALIVGIAKAFGQDITMGDVKIPKIPKLATGGYVAANSPQLAIIGDNKREGEIVAPESKIAEAVAAGVAAAMRQFIGIMNNGGSTKQATPIVIKIGEDDFWSGFIDYHNSVVKRTGDSPLLI